MSDSNPDAEKNKSESLERLSPGAIAHYCHWARVFIERFYKEKFKKSHEYDESASNVLTQILGDLREFPVALMEMERIDDSELKKAKLGEYVIPKVQRLVDTLTCAYLAAHTLMETDTTLEAGSSEPDDFAPEQKALTQKNLERLSNGLKASIASFGAAYTGIAANPKADPSYRRTALIGEPRLGHRYDRASMTTVQRFITSFNALLAPYLEAQSVNVNPNLRMMDDVRLCYGAFKGAFKAERETVKKQSNASSR